MKDSHLIIIVGIVITGSVIFGLTFKMPLDGSGQISFESPLKEHYSIEITGMKDVYRIGEQYDFSYIISGYGYSCGSKKITFPDQNGNTMMIIDSSSCMAESPMKGFVYDTEKELLTTSVHGTIKIPGIYNVTITFDRPSQEFPTTAIKEFRVVDMAILDHSRQVTGSYELEGSVCLGGPNIEVDENCVRINKEK